MEIGLFKKTRELDNKINEFLEEYKVVRRKRFIDKVEDTSNLLTIVQAMMEQ